LQLNNTDSQQNAKQNARSDVTKYWYRGEVQEWASEEGKKRKVAAISFAVLGASDDCWTQLSEHTTDVGQMSS